MCHIVGTGIYLRSRQHHAADGKPHAFYSNVKYLAIFQNRGTSIIYVQGADIFRGPLFYRRLGERFCGLWQEGGIFSNRTWQRFYPKGLRTPERDMAKILPKRAQNTRKGGATFNFRCQSGEIYGPPDINCGRSLCTCFSYIQVKSSWKGHWIYTPGVNYWVSLAKSFHYIQWLHVDA